MTPDEAARIAFGTLIEEFNTREEELIEKCNASERALKSEQEESDKLYKRLDELDAAYVAKERSIVSLENEVLKLKDRVEEERQGRIKAVKAQRKAEQQLENCKEARHRVEEELENKNDFHERRYRKLAEEKGELTNRLEKYEG